MSIMELMTIPGLSDTSKLEKMREDSQKRMSAMIRRQSRTYKGMAKKESVRQS